MITEKSIPNEYYYLIMSQADFIKNQVLEEVLRERANYYFSKNKPLDFWISVSPSFIKNLKLEEKIKKTNFYIQKKEEKPEYNIALISLDKEFINWIQLRLGYFENINNQLNSKYISDGIYGSFDLNLLKKINSNLSPLESNKNFLNPNIILNGYKKIISINN